MPTQITTSSSPASSARSQSARWWSLCIGSNSWCPMLLSSSVVV
jgi:hypothetical protein